MPDLPCVLCGQVTVLSSGMMMYFGSHDKMVPWFSDKLGYAYDAAMHGVPSDWVMDLVNVGFQKPEVGDCRVLIAL